MNVRGFFRKFLENSLGCMVCSSECVGVNFWAIYTNFDLRDNTRQDNKTNP